jgi:hypothetical protein
LCQIGLLNVDLTTLRPLSEHPDQQVGYKKLLNKRGVVVFPSIRKNFEQDPSQIKLLLWMFVPWRDLDWIDQFPVSDDNLVPVQLSLRMFYEMEILRNQFLAQYVQQSHIYFETWKKTREIRLVDSNLEPFEDLLGNLNIDSESDDDSDFVAQQFGV